MGLKALYVADDRQVANGEPLCNLAFFCVESSLAELVSIRGK